MSTYEKFCEHDGYDLGR